MAVLVAFGATAVVAPAAGAAPKKNPKSPQETSAYWTSERMRVARPRPLAKPDRAGGGDRQADWSSSAVPLDGGRYTGEHAKNGKVFFTIGGTDYVCSGTAVAASPGINLVWTAGHCVTDGPNDYASNFMFVPGYSNGAAPHGRWTFTELDSTPGWESRDFRHDVGAARVVHSTSPGATFASTIGTRPIAFGVDPTGRRLVSFGYPAARKFSGAQQYQCASPFRRWDVTAFTDPMQMSCDMTGGSSGGGWIHDADNDSVGDPGEPLVSVNSYGYANEKTTMYGPYMPSGSQAKTLYDAMD
jgi:hypothetical protein